MRGVCPHKLRCAGRQRACERLSLRRSHRVGSRRVHHCWGIV